MTDRPETRHREARTAVSLALLMLCTACTVEPDAPTGPPTAPGTTSTDDDPRVQEAPDDVAGIAPALSLEARLVEWDERSLRVAYALRNDGPDPLVVLDDYRTLQIERLDDGRIRLFRGMQDTGNTAFYVPPTIEGRELAPGERAEGTGSRDVPLRLDYADRASERPIDPATDTVEFCIGHGDPDTLAAVRQDDGSYSLNRDPSLQRLSCTVLERAPAPDDGAVSPLDDARWEHTLERALETIGGDARDIAIVAALALDVPDSPSGTADGVTVSGTPETVVYPDGTLGTRTRATCEGGGGFELVRTSDGLERDVVLAERCTLGPFTVDGRVTREIVAATDVPGTTTVRLEDVAIEYGSERLSISQGVYRTRLAYPENVTEWIGTSYRLDEGGEVRTVADLQLEDIGINGTAFDRYLTASFTVAAGWTNDAPLAITTPQSFAGLTVDPQGYFSHGALVLETPDGERLRLDADSGRPGEVLITLERRGTVTSLYRPWPAGLR